MGISPLELNGTIARTQDYSVIRQNEEQKGMLDQSHFQNQLDKELNQKPHMVSEHDNANYHNRRHDAKDKGNNSYSGDGGKDRRDSQKGKEHVASKVTPKVRGGFDVKI